MNEQDFDKKIGARLRINKEFVPSKEQWTKMNHLLNQTKTKHRRILLPWFITAITLIGAGSYTTHLNHKMNHLQHEIDFAQITYKDRSNIHMITDTCFSEIDLIKKNIVIKNIYKTNYVWNSSNVGNNIEAKENDIITQTKFVDHSDVLINSKQSYSNHYPFYKTSNSEKNLIEKNNLAPINGSELSNSEPIINTNNKSESTSQIKNNDTINIHENKALVDKILINKSIDSLEKIEKKHFIEMNKQSNSKPFKIKSFEIGILAGYAGSKPREVNKQYGYITGLQANIFFKNKLSVSANLDYINLTFEHDSYEATDLPQINPPSPDDVLKDITVIKPYFNYYLGLNYSPFTWNLRPFFGFGFSGLMRLEPTNNYQFENTKTKEETNTINNTYSKVNTFPNYNVRLGLEYPIYYPLIWKIEGTYTLNSNNKYKYQPLYNIKTGVAIRF